MSFKFHCDCGQKLSATDDMIGTDATCPNCSALITIAQPRPTTPDRPPSHRALPVFQRDEPIPPRPALLLRGLGSLAAMGLAGELAWLLGDRFIDLLWHFMGAILALPIGAMIAAAFLQVSVKIVARFDLPFGEATSFSLLTASIMLASELPTLALAKEPVLAKPPGLALLGVALLLTLVCYAMLIRDDLCRPIGWAKGFLAWLVNFLLVAVVFGALRGLWYLLWRLA